MDINEILGLLPHRYPMVLVDRILELDPGERAVGLKNVTANEQFFVGHFPGNPVMPAVLILESMAQIGGVMLLSAVDEPDKIPLFTGVDKARFRSPVRPGDQLITECTLEHRHGLVGRVRAVARVDGKVVAEATYLYALVDELKRPDRLERTPAGAF